MQFPAFLILVCHTQVLLKYNICPPFFSKREVRCHSCLCLHKMFNELEFSHRNMMQSLNTSVNLKPFLLSA